MKGRPVLLSDASVTAFWVWLKAKYGFTDAQVRKYTFNAAPFLADKRAVQQGYLTSEPYTLEKEAGLKAKVFLLADSGYPGYAAIVLAPQSLISSKPEVVRAFVEGTAAGWKSYLNSDPAPGDALILKDNPDMKADILAQARGKMKANGIVESGDAMAMGIGAMTDARWQDFYETAARNVYPPDLDWKSAYTLEFVTPAQTP
jgi:NitT/TauT family transport system substrate-binding protein